MQGSVVDNQLRCLLIGFAITGVNSNLGVRVQQLCTVIGVFAVLFGANMSSYHDIKKITVYCTIYLVTMDTK